MATDEKRMAQLRGRKVRPMTPGQMLGGMLEEWGLSQREVSRRLGVSAVSVSELIRDERRLTPDMAQRIGRLVGNGPDFWLRAQQIVDLWDMIQMDQRKYRDIRPLSEEELKVA